MLADIKGCAPYPESPAVFSKSFTYTCSSFNDETLYSTLAMIWRGSVLLIEKDSLPRQGF